MKKFAPRTARLAGVGAAAFVLALAAPTMASAAGDGPSCGTTHGDGVMNTFHLTDEGGCSTDDSDHSVLTITEATVEDGLATATPNGDSVEVTGLPLVGEIHVDVTVEDDLHRSAQWAIIITLVAEDPDATATPDGPFAVTAGESKSGDVTSNDVGYEGWDAVVVSQPAKGTVELNKNGKFTYTANAGSEGADFFVYQLVKGDRSSESANVSFNISATGGGGGDGDDDDNDNDNDNDGNTGDNTGNTGANASDKDKLAKTGTSLTAIGLTGAGVLAAGAGALWFTRRRRAEQV